MSFPLLAASVGFAVFAAVTSLASIVVWSIARCLGDANEDSASLARRLFTLRVLPSLIGIGAATGVALPAFLLFEPRGLEETPGKTLTILALLGAAWVVAGIRRASGELWIAFRMARRWVREGRPISPGSARVPVYSIRHPFPLVSVVGMLRARLFVSERVLESLSASELEAVFSHEASHLERRDNLRRLAIRLAPALPWPSAAQDLEKRWEQAAEEACDATASDSLAMASALVKTARLASSAARIEIPAAAFHRGGSLARRVQLLTETGTSVRIHHPRRLWPGGWALATASALTCLFFVSGGVHRLIELLVHFP